MNIIDLFREPKAVNDFHYIKTLRVSIAVNSLTFSHDETQMYVTGNSVGSVLGVSIDSRAYFGSTKTDGVAHSYDAIAFLGGKIYVIEGSGARILRLNAPSMLPDPFDYEAVAHVADLSHDYRNECVVVSYRNLSKTIPFNIGIYHNSGRLLYRINAGINVYATAFVGKYLYVVGSRREPEGRLQLIRICPQSGRFDEGPILANKRVDDAKITSDDQNGYLAVTFTDGLGDLHVQWISYSTGFSTVNSKVMEGYTCRKLRSCENGLLLLLSDGASRNTLNFISSKSLENKTLLSNVSGFALSDTHRTLAIAKSKKVLVYKKET